MNICNEIIYLDLLPNNPGVEREGGLDRSEADRSRVETEGLVYIVDDTVLSTLHFLWQRIKVNTVQVKQKSTHKPNSVLPHVLEAHNDSESREAPPSPVCTAGPGR